MPIARTLAEIRTSSRRKAQQDQLGTGPLLVSESEQTEYIHESLASLWEMLMEAGGEALLSTRVERTETTLLLPDDFYKLLRLEVQEGSRWVRLERLRDEDQTAAERWAGTPRAYAIRGAREINAPVRLYPQPTADKTYRIEYVPEPPIVDPGDDGPAVDLELPNRWWQWVELDVAAQMMAKEESDASAVEARRDRIGKAIVRSAVSTDHGSPRTIRDTRGIVPGRNLRREEMVTE